MAVINDPDIAADVARVGEVATGSTGAAVAAYNPDPAVIGHYRTAGKFRTTTFISGANFFEVRNPSPNVLVVPTRLQWKIASADAHTAIQDQSFEGRRLTSFTTSATTSATTMVASSKRSTMPAPVAIVKRSTSGSEMTGMVATDAGLFGAEPIIEAVAAMAAAETVSRYYDVGNFIVDDNYGTHPYVFAQNEGFRVEQRALGQAADGIFVYLDFSWCEVASF